MNAHTPIEALLEERFELVDSEARLAAIEPAWSALWRRGPGLLFHTHAWVAAWWRTVPGRDGRQLRIGLIWRGDELLAILPLAIQRRKGLRFLEWAANDCTDYPDILLDPRCPAAAVTRLWHEVVAAGGFDLYFLNRLRPHAKFRALLDAPDGLRLAANHRTETCSQVVGDWTAGAQWFDQQSKKTRQNYRRGVKTLEESGELVFRLLPPDAPVAPVLDRLAALKRQWLADSGRVSPLFDAGAPALPALVEVLAKAGALRIFVLECNGAIIAISLNFVDDDTLMAFLTSYDPKFERGSPGMVLLMDYVQWSIDQGLKGVDFLCGEEPFKEKFATRSTRLASVMGPRTLKGRLAMLVDRLRQRWQSRTERAV
ncbi:GNAT family N-acetyltransferase [Devosia sp. A16]|uniref:GNAT family N-acetyltransferase n=1 Tax=Devosia sp. A16 TaxID=1736675 RepID=UPI0006D85914|nr:GNAT family N-acetyltransferase [Devosia sp. A16]